MMMKACFVAPAQGPKEVGRAAGGPRGARPAPSKRQGAQGRVRTPGCRPTSLPGRGAAAATVWTSDVSNDYVRINAEYRT